MNRASSGTSNYALRKVRGALNNESGTHVLYITKGGPNAFKKSAKMEIKYATPNAQEEVILIKGRTNEFKNVETIRQIKKLLKIHDKIIIQIKK